jgi:hypothetical protein
MKLHRWEVGDRAVWPHREGHGKGRHTVRSAGTVIAVDLPNLPSGVDLRFDEPVSGVTTAYATHEELEREAEK